MSISSVFTEMEKMVGKDTLKLPPNCHETMESEIQEYIEGESLTASFPIYEKYDNPAGVTLGGFLPVFFDLTFGPLSYLLAKRPTVSLDLNTSFIRPVTAKDEKVTVKASVVHKGKSYLILEAKAWVAEDRLVATASSRMRIL